MPFKWLYGCSGGLYTAQGIICCSGGLYAAQEGYMDDGEGFILLWGVKCCSGGLYRCSGEWFTVQGGYMLFHSDPLELKSLPLYEVTVPMVG